MAKINHKLKKGLNCSSFKQATQQGVVLIVCLILLLLLTLIGTTGMQMTSLEEKMASNMRDRNLAFQAAESALVAGETWLETVVAIPVAFCSKANGRYLPLDKDCNGATAETEPVWDSIGAWDNTNSVAYAGELSNLSADPRYIIEDMGCLPAPAACPGIHNYRITARATGGSPDSVVILQSIYQI
jgi:type IV pilus assembly protein PilX